MVLVVFSVPQKYQKILLGIFYLPDSFIFQDLADDRKALPVHQRRSNVAEEYGTEEIHLKSTDEKSLMPGSSASNKLSRFFDKVIEKQFYRRDKSGSFGSTGQERRRLVQDMHRRYWFSGKKIRQISESCSQVSEITAI